MSATVLVVDDEENARMPIINILTRKGYEAIGAATLAEARHVLESGAADVITLDVNLPDGNGLDLLDETAQMVNRPPIIVVTAFGEIDMAVNAMKNGAHDFLQKPIDVERMEKSIRRAAEQVALRRELNHLRSQQRKNLDFVPGHSPDMQKLLNLAQRAAEASVSVLLSGESGTGKEVIANFILQNGPRASKPFVAINCAAIQSTLLESELFGQEAGAFTDAKRKPGLMEVADGGILFLDEISSMPLDLQAKLLRALESKSFRRVGGTNLIKVDIQIIAASNRNLPQMIKDERFREDLYYRLRGIELHLPALRDRKADIPDLVGYLIRKYNMEKGMNFSGVTPRALDAMIAYTWPGNIRELAHAIEHAMIFCDEETIDLPHLPLEVSQAGKG
ncbi:MAG TPA: sigma-54 dependent transcriptional regulator [Anaerolineaceae bacterium]|nr:sigma-54 dependent transcriptional regulator [Anaerolineaceae bacterium]HPN52960.1 sigma-54 dependent transcriptional regulator [Anaerolineaceae bacterium]